MTDWQKKIKALEDRLEQLESYTARQKRVLDDLLANLDDDNMSETLLREKKQMKDKDIQLQSMIEQTAGSITMQVKKKFASMSGIVRYENDKPPYHPLEEHLSGVSDWNNLLWENVWFEGEKRYYFWNELVDGWSYTDSTEIQSLFVQTEDGFYLSSEVVIDGNLITRGKITASEVYASRIFGATKDQVEGYDNRDEPWVVMDEYGYKLFISGGVQKFGVTVDNSGVPIMVFGQGTGGTVSNINGVRIANGMFVIEKGSNVTVLGIRGSGAQMAFNSTDGSINLYGKVTIGDSGYDGNEVATRAYVNSAVQSVLGSLGSD